MKIPAFLFFVFFSIILNAQTFKNYLVYFSDKDTTADLHNFFDPKAIERRELQHIKFDFWDYPVKQQYVDEVNKLVDTIFYTYRWFNAVWVSASGKQIDDVRKLPFVTRIKSLGSYNGVRMTVCKADSSVFLKNDKTSRILRSQIESMKGEEFSKNGYTGKGIRIAVLDAGFTKADKSVFLRHLFERGKILKAYDFIKKDTIKYKHSAHGRMTLACIAGKKGDTAIGLAWDAEFLLARTEYNLIEPFKEELLWAKAAEWADKNGAYIISSSLGYELPRYWRNDMDGKTSYVTRAAKMAARKGILVVNAAGNSGDSGWRMLGAPADADSIITVGGTRCCYPLPISFTGVGPTYDGRIKPEVSANAEVMSDGITRLSHTYGTSFSTPLVAGFAACAWQKERGLTNMQLRDKIIQSGSLYPYYDFAMGYGIPQATFFTAGVKHYNSSGKLGKLLGNDDYIGVTVTDADFDKDVIYFRVEDKAGNIIKYGETVIKSKMPLYFRKDYITGKVLRVFYNGEIKAFYL